MTEVTGVRTQPAHYEQNAPIIERPATTIGGSPTKTYSPDALAKTLPEDVKNTKAGDYLNEVNNMNIAKANHDKAGENVSKERAEAAFSFLSDNEKSHAMAIAHDTHLINGPYDQAAPVVAGSILEREGTLFNGPSYSHFQTLSASQLKTSIETFEKEYNTKLSNNQKDYINECNNAGIATRKGDANAANEASERADALYSKLDPEHKEQVLLFTGIQNNVGW